MKTDHLFISIFLKFFQPFLDCGEDLGSIIFVGYAKGLR